MWKNKNKVLIILASLIALSVCLLIGYVLSKPEEMDINSDLVRELYNSVNPSSDASVLSLLYTTNPLSNEYIIDIGLMAYIKEHKADNIEIIPREKVEEKIEKILGPVPYMHSNVYLLEEVCGYTYNNEQNSP